MRFEGRSSAVRAFGGELRDRVGAYGAARGSAEGGGFLRRRRGRRGGAYARAAGKPIVIERLDFRRKKAVPTGENRRYRRMLSSFNYGKRPGMPLG